MGSALHIARSGLEALDARLKTISNNLANVNTIAFKRDRAAFETLFYQRSRPAGALASADMRYGMGLTSGMGVRVAGNERIHSQGTFTITNNALDLAIDGDGFFEIDKPDGTKAYTRAGSFTKDSEGRFVTPQGYRLSPEIQIPEGASSVTVGADGTVSAVLPNETNATEIGQLSIATFINQNGLEPIGENLFQETAASGQAQIVNANQNGVGSIRQGAIEGSNVSSVQELVDMIETQRAYEINSKVISTADEMMQYVNQAI